ncbi:6986_t:CDS:1 [Ambispora leptoticha]|uniref:6986_t:CDS:1 n=1 Tax=Ambispora leptoticha TaxID=144679 RepID=A0A9N9F0A9_9GLOM|nr:6986_t:CDS:1 [Ambispora leptoticha]
MKMISPPSSAASSYSSNLSSSLSSICTIDRQYELHQRHQQLLSRRYDDFYDIKITTTTTTDFDTEDDCYSNSYYSTSAPIEIPGSDCSTGNEQALEINKGTFGENSHLFN